MLDVRCAPLSVRCPSMRYSREEFANHRVEDTRPRQLQLAHPLAVDVAKLDRVAMSSVAPYCNAGRACLCVAARARSYTEQRHTTEEATREPRTVNTVFAAACVTGWQRIVPQIFIFNSCLTTLPFLGTRAFAGTESGMRSKSADIHVGRGPLRS